MDATPTMPELDSMARSLSGLALTDPLAAVKRCACGREYTIETWRALRHCGVQVLEADDGQPAEVYELRHCTCGSTICVPMRAVVHGEVW